MNAQKFHHPDLTTPLATTTVKYTIKFRFFYILFRLGSPGDDSIHLHIHYTNAQPQLTRDASNTDIAVVLTNGCDPFHDPFQSFFCDVLDQYDKNT